MNVCETFRPLDTYTIKDGNGLNKRCFLIVYCVTSLVSEAREREEGCRKSWVKDSLRDLQSES